ncbi:MAG: dienelactone hydrolase family protein [Gemmataceae bacterium]
MKRAFYVLAFLAVSASSASGEVRTKTITYKDGDTTLRGVLTWDDSVKGQRPGVLVVHEWWGLDDYAKSRAKQLAKLGYAAFAVDMYGKGKITEHPMTARKWSGMVRKNQKAWRSRAQLGLDILKKQKMVDGSRLAAIGYCFGGSTVLQLAYSGADLDAVVTFHGGLMPPAANESKAIKAKVLICHGADDKFIPEKVAKQVKQALKKAGVLHKFVAYPGAVHSFTVPEADKRGIPGIAYDQKADEGSWREMRRLFKRVFQDGTR